jgi:hypothetical protein
VSLMMRVVHRALVITLFQERLSAGEWRAASSTEAWRGRRRERLPDLA